MDDFAKLFLNPTTINIWNNFPEVPHTTHYVSNTEIISRKSTWGEEPSLTWKGVAVLPAKVKQKTRLGDGLDILYHAQALTSIRSI